MDQGFTLAAIMNANTWLNSLYQFFSSGGWVLLLLLWTALVLWVLIFERLWFRLRVFPQLKQQCLNMQIGSADEGSLIRNVGRLKLSLQESFPLIKTLIAICPLIGLLGTVTGMIQVFDVLAFNGSGNIRLMSAGVAKATIPTMVGMVLAVSGLLAYTLLQRWAQLQLVVINQMSMNEYHNQKLQAQGHKKVAHAK